MQFADVLRSSVLLILGAGASALGFLAAREPERHEVTLASDQLQFIVARLASLEEHLLAGLESGHHAVGADAAPQAITRSADRDGDTARLLTEIRDELKTIVYGVGHDPNLGATDASRKTETLAKTVETDGADSKKIMRRHFCQTLTQVYATYGMPDMKDGGVGAQYWRYRVEGVGWI